MLWVYARAPAIIGGKLNRRDWFMTLFHFSLVSTHIARTTQPKLLPSPGSSSFFFCYCFSYVLFELLPSFLPSYHFTNALLHNFFFGVSDRFICSTILSRFALALDASAHFYIEPRILEILWRFFLLKPGNSSRGLNWATFTDFPGHLRNFEPIDISHISEFSEQFGLELQAADSFRLGESQSVQ